MTDEAAATPPEPAGAFDEVLVRRFWVLKTYGDVVVDGGGAKPIDSDEVLRPRSAADFQPEDFGYLTQPVRIAKWIDVVSSRYSFLADADDDEIKCFTCNARDFHAMESELAALHVE